jgi:hypothetical protein
LELVIVPDRAKAQHTWPRRSRSSLNPLLRGGFSCKLMVMDTIIWFCFLMSFITESFIQAILYFKSELFEFAYLSFCHTHLRKVSLFTVLYLHIYGNENISFTFGNMLDVHKQANMRHTNKSCYTLYSESLLYTQTFKKMCLLDNT